MIHINLLQADTTPRSTRMPAVEFGGRVGSMDGHIHEIELGHQLTIVMDEHQVIELVAKLLDAIPPMTSGDEDEKGEVPA